jgi:hypothetical protein
MVDVGDDGDIADVFAGCGHFRRRHVYSAGRSGASSPAAWPAQNTPSALDFPAFL